MRKEDRVLNVNEHVCMVVQSSRAMLTEGMSSEPMDRNKWHLGRRHIVHQPSVGVEEGELSAQQTGGKNDANRLFIAHRRLHLQT